MSLRGGFVLPARSMGAIRMKNGPLRPAPPRGAPEDAEAPRAFHQAVTGPVVRAGALRSRTQCMPWGRGDAPPCP